MHELTWESVRLVAETAFQIFANHSAEWRWAERTWHKLGTVGLTRYVNDLERTRVKIRFIALACIYNDFWEVSWDEESNSYVGSWGRMFDLSPFRVGQLAGVDFSQDDIGDDASSDEELVDFALDTLVGQARAEIGVALIKVYGGPERLLVSLYHVCQPPERRPAYLKPDYLDESPNPSSDIDDQPTSEEFTEEDADLVNDDGFVEEYGAAYDWILNGCPTIERNY